MTKETETKINELKAFAYDLLAQIDYCRSKLTETNQKIAELSKASETQVDLKVVS